MSENAKKKANPNRLALQMVIALAAGIVAGLIFMAIREKVGGETWNTLNNLLFQDITAEGAESAIGLFYIGGQLFVRALQVIIVPMIFTSIAMAIGTVSDARTLGRISTRTLLWFLMTTVGGLLLAVAMPWLAALAAWLEVRAARQLLGPNRAEQLEQRVEEIAESRAGLVDAVDAERRRIERDLHDGAQQRLTSLAMNLGLARRTLKDVPPEVMQVIVEAHEEAQAAIDELRDLVRGLHPAVLEDRGLDAALSGIAARAPLPVRLDVELSGQIAPTVEAVAYFTVSEALTNVAKHARAKQVDVSVRTTGDRLRLIISDDGVGGADPSRGTGLTGLRKRAASVDGTLSVLSPLGGPTTITVELPCVL